MHSIGRRVPLDLLFLLYYQCKNPSIIVRQHDQGASTSYYVTWYFLGAKNCWRPNKDQLIARLVWFCSHFIARQCLFHPVLPWEWMVWHGTNGISYSLKLSHVFLLAASSRVARYPPKTTEIRGRNVKKKNTSVLFPTLKLPDLELHGYIHEYTVGFFKKLIFGWDLFPAMRESWLKCLPANQGASTGGHSLSTAHTQC